VTAYFPSSDGAIIDAIFCNIYFIAWADGAVFEPFKIILHCNSVTHHWTALHAISPMLIIAVLADSAVFETPVMAI